MQRAGQHLPGPFAADMSNRDRIACIEMDCLRGARAYSAACERPGGGRARHRLCGYDAYREGPSIGVIRALSEL